MSVHVYSNKNTREREAIVAAFFGAILTLAAVLTLWSGISSYLTQLHQVDWTVTDAEVAYVEEELRTTGGYKHTSTSTVYDVHYQYFVDGRLYHGSFEQTAELEVGDIISIKYDPSHPEDSTGTLKPSLAGVIIGTLLGIAAIAAFVISHAIKKGKKQSG